MREWTEGTSARKLESLSSNSDLHLVSVELDEPMAVWLPMVPLLDVLESHLARLGVGLKYWCESKGICVRTLQRARKTGRVSWKTADEVSCAIGLHPSLIWGSLW